MTDLLGATTCQQAELLAVGMSSEPMVGVTGRSIRIGSEYRITDVQRAWMSLLRTYPALRIRFREQDGRILQEMRAYQRLPLLAKIVLVPGRRVDIARACIQPYRSVLTRAYFAPDSHGGTFTLLAHRALVDEHALGVIMESLRRGMSEPGLIAAAPDADYAATVNALVATERDSSGNSINFLSRRLDAAGSAPDQVRPPGPATRSESWQADLDDARVQALNACARHMNVSTLDLLHAAVTVLLYRCGLGNQPMVGVRMSLRDHPAVGLDAVGPYTITLPVEVQVRGSDTLRTILGRAHEALARAQQHKFLPLMNIPGFAELVMADGDDSQFGVKLSASEIGSDSTLFQMRPLPIGHSAAALHIDLTLAPDRGRLALMRCDGDTPWPEPASITAHLMDILDMFAGDPDHAVDGVELNTEVRSHSISAGSRDDAPPALRVDMRLPQPQRMGLPDHAGVPNALQRHVPTKMGTGALSLPDLPQPRSQWPPPTGVEDIWSSSIGRWADRAPSPLVPLVAHGHGAPLFCVHWGVGTIRFIADHVEDFRLGHPVYALEAVGYRGNVRPLLSITEMAERYITEIRTVQPTGPYHIAGLCQGAIIALEMARLLRAAGEQIAPLALVALPSQPPPFYDPGWGLDEIYAIVCEQLPAMGNGIKDSNDVTRAMTELVEMGFYEPDDDPADLHRLAAVYAACCFAQDHHEPAPYDGSVVIMVMAAKAQRLRSTWGHLLTDFQLVPGDWEAVLDMTRDHRFGEILQGILTSTHRDPITASKPELIAADRSPSRQTSKQ